MKPGLSLRVSQHLALTPQLQQSIRLLQLSTLELEGEIEQMLADNPFLERDDGLAEREDFGVAQADQRVSEGDRISEHATDGSAEHSESPPEPDDWDGEGATDLAADDGEWGGEAPARNSAADGDALDVGERAPSGPSLAEHLHQQALTLRLSPEDAAVLGFLIESLNEDGYLEDSLAQLAATLIGADDDDLEQLQELVHRFSFALKLLQSLEPTGVGARDAPECLRLQLLALKADGTTGVAHSAGLGTALRICALPDALSLLARRDLRRLGHLLEVDDDAVRAALALITRLNPKPGARFAQVEHLVVVPDVIVSTTGAPGTERLQVQLNPDVMPRLRVHEAYAHALRGGKGEAPHVALGQHLQEARWFIRNIQQRFDTILRVARAIVRHQHGFFTHGELAMRPLVQRELAVELALHESTISRVTTAKYMATPRGTFELKYFFGSALGTEAGGNASSTAVRALIRQFIDAEDRARPLSDNRLSEMLKEQGIDCARRTVAKYREALKIAPTHLRKTP